KWCGRCAWIRAIIRLKARCCALRWIAESRNRGAGCINTRSVQGGINNAEVIVLAQKGLLIGSSDLEIVLALHVGNIRAQSRVRELSCLRNRLLLQWSKIGK